MRVYGDYNKEVVQKVVAPHSARDSTDLRLARVDINLSKLQLRATGTHQSRQ